MKKSTIVAVLVGGLVLGFLGGLVGSVLFSKGEDTSALESRISSVETSISSLQKKVDNLAQSPGLKVGYVDAENLFIRVFLTQVESERQAMAKKQQEIRELQAKYLQGQLTQDQYQQEAAKLQVELLQTQLNVDLSMLDKMIASPGFTNFRADLERIREQARPIEDEVQNLIQNAQVGIVDMEGFLAQYQQLQSAFQQLDQLLTQAAAAKIVEIAQQVAKEKGFDLLLRKKDVLIYRNEDTIIDISGDVETRLWNLFPPKS